MNLDDVTWKESLAGIGLALLVCVGAAVFFGLVTIFINGLKATF